MISCPHCQAENEAEANACRACDNELTPVAASEGLPPWLQALKPDQSQEAEAADAPAASLTEDAPQDEPLALPPMPVMVGGGGNAAPGTGGTDTLVATQPTPPSRAVPPRASAPPSTQSSEGPTKGSSNSTAETASLINEDDLPAWLRAFSETDTTAQATQADEQSWMTGNGTSGAEETLSGNLAQSWQVPARTTTPQRSSAVSVFGASEEGGAKVTRATKPERTVAPAPEPKPSAPLPTVTTKSATPARLGANRPVPKSQERASLSIQRVATIAFILAFIIFLVVLGIFVVGPALAG